MKNQIDITTEINEETFKTFEKFVSSTKRNYQIKLLSEGGDPYYASKIMILMQNEQYPKFESVHGSKIIASCAVYLYIMAEYRVCEQTTQFHIHRHRDATTKEIPENLTKDELMFIKVFCWQTGIDLQKALDLMNANGGQGTWLKAYEAERLGIVHKVW